MQPDGGGRCPAGGPVAFVTECAGLIRRVVAPGSGAAFDHLGNGRPLIIRPAGKGHPFAVEEEFRHHRRIEKGVGKRRNVAHAQQRKVARQHRSYRSFRQAREYAFVRNRRKSVRGNSAAAQQPHLFALDCPVDHRRAGRAAVPGSKDERFV